MRLNTSLTVDILLHLSAGTAMLPKHDKNGPHLTCAPSNISFFYVTFDIYIGFALFVLNICTLQLRPP